MRRPNLFPRVTSALIAAFIGLAALAAASAGNFDLLNYVPANEYHAVVSVSPSKIFSAPLVADLLTNGKARKILARLEVLQNATGINARTDLDAVVLAGNPPNRPDSPREGVAIVRGRWDKTKFLDALAKAPDFTTKKENNQTYYTFTSPRDGKAKALAFLEDKLLAVGPEKAVVAVLNHGASPAGSLAADESMKSLSGEIPSNADFWILVRSPREIVRFPHFRPAAAHLENLAAWGTVGKTLSVEARLTADTPEHAQEMEAALQGLVALGRLQLDNTSGTAARPIDALRPLIDKVKFGVDDRTVKVGAEFTGADLKSIHQARAMFKEGRSRFGFRGRAGH